MMRTTSVLAATLFGATALFSAAEAETLKPQRAVAPVTAPAIVQTIKIPMSACMDEMNDTLNTLFKEARSENDESLVENFLDIYRLMNRQSRTLSAGSLLIGQRILKSLDEVSISPECEMALQKRFANALTPQPKVKRAPIPRL